MENMERNTPEEKTGTAQKSMKEIMKLMETVVREDLSMLICYHEDDQWGMIFQHCREYGMTVLRKFSDTCWDVYGNGVSGMAKQDAVRSYSSMQEAIQKALKNARYAKLRKSKPGTDAKDGLLHWTMDKEGTLTLSGKGPMIHPQIKEARVIDEAQMAFELEYGNWLLDVGDVDWLLTFPWNGEKVKKAIVSPGLTTVSFDAFSRFSVSINGCSFIGEYKNLTEIHLPDTVKELEYCAISHCPVLEKAVIPASVTEIYESQGGQYVFSDCPKLTIYTPAGSYAEAYAKRHGIPVVLTNP